MRGMVCGNCGYKAVEKSQMGEFVLRVSDAYRAAHGLLTSAEIKGRRATLGMSQEQFAEHVGVGVASIKRWELGQVQDEALNSLMVLRTDACAAHKNLQEVATLAAWAHPAENQVESAIAMQITSGGHYVRVFWPTKQRHQQFQMMPVQGSDWETAPTC